MSDKTAIEWTDARWNPIRARNRHTGKLGWHCEHASDGCRFCYAERRNRWIGTGLHFKPGHRDDVEIVLDEKALLKPLKWHKAERIFVCTMTDLFADFVSDEMIDHVFAAMALCPQHRFQVLTKRSARMRAYASHPEREAKWMNAVGRVLEDRSLTGYFPILEQHEPWLPLPNVWLGVSAEDQKNWNERKEDLRATPAAVRFASFEPLLGPIDIDAPWLDWAIVGGESGPHARPMHPDWPRSLRDQCQAAGVPFFFKQWGEHAPTLCDKLPVEMIRVGKKRAGRLFDGVEHNAIPGRT